MTSGSRGLLTPSCAALMIIIIGLFVKIPHGRSKSGAGCVPACHIAGQAGAKSLPSEPRSLSVCGVDVVGASGTVASRHLLTAKAPLSVYKGDTVTQCTGATVFFF